MRANHVARLLTAATLIAAVSTLGACSNDVAEPAPASASASAGSWRDGDSADMQPLVRAMPPPSSVPAVRLGDVPLEPVSYYWMNEADAVQGGPTTASEAVERHLQSVDSRVVHGALEFTIEHPTLPAIALVHLFPDLSESGQPDGIPVEIDCSPPAPPSSAQCGWVGTDSGLLLTVTPGTHVAKAVRLSLFYSVPPELRPTDARGPYSTATWVVVDDGR